MGAIGRELIRRSQERIIAMEREIDELSRGQGWEHRIADLKLDVERERSALAEKIRMEGPEATLR